MIALVQSLFPGALAVGYWIIVAATCHISSLTTSNPATTIPGYMIDLYSVLLQQYSVGAKASCLKYSVSFHLDPFS